MVLGEVGEAGYVHHHLVGAVQHQGVGGDLHPAHLDAVLDHAGQEAVELRGFRGGAHGADQVLVPGAVAVAGATGSHHTARTTQLQQRAVDHGGHGGLAVGARDADGAQLLGGPAVDEGGGAGGVTSGVLDHQCGQAGSFAGAGPGPVGECEDGTAVGGLLREVRAVGVGPGQSAPQVTGLHASGVQGDAGELLGGRGRRYRRSEFRGERGCSHPGSVAGTGGFGGAPLGHWAAPHSFSSSRAGFPVGGMPWCCRVKVISSEKAGAAALPPEMKELRPNTNTPITISGSSAGA